MKKFLSFFFLLLFLLLPVLPVIAAGGSHASAELTFPLSFDSYQDTPGASVIDILSGRIAQEPFNLVATIIFLLAILHAFGAAGIQKWAHAAEHAHQKKLKKQSSEDKYRDHVDEVCFKAQVLHFFGEVEAIFGIWALVLAVAFTLEKGGETFLAYIDSVNYTEPIFVVVIMALAASRPIIQYSEICVKFLAQLIGGKPWAYWWIILTVTPILGSFITEPAAMTIAALLLSKKIYENELPDSFAYATLGLLFVNVSIGGTFTNFAAPPVLMVAAAWDWSPAYMLEHFGWRAFLAIITSNAIYFFVFRKILFGLKSISSENEGSTDAKNIHWEDRPERVPLGILFCHILFIAGVVLFAHHVKIFVAIFLFFLAFVMATAHHQNRMNLKPPMLVGFFLAGLVTHGGLQGWWIAPVLQSFDNLTLFWGATILTAFNDNAAITYLSTLVPNFSEAAEYAVVAGAVTGGGLTVIANAPNPAGQAILSKHFKGGVSPLKLFLGALIPTLITAFYFLLSSPG